MLAYVLLSLLVFEHGLIQICFGIFEFLPDIFSIKFYTISFLWKHNFFIDEKHTQWMLDTKVKVFHESISCFMKWPWNCISWNALKEKFHSVSFPLPTHFFNLVYLCLCLRQGLFMSYWRDLFFIIFFIYIIINHTISLKQTRLFFLPILFSSSTNFSQSVA